MSQSQSNALKLFDPHHLRLGPETLHVLVGPLPVRRVKQPDSVAHTALSVHPRRPFASFAATVSAHQPSLSLSLDLAATCPIPRQTACTRDSLKTTNARLITTTRPILPSTRQAHPTSQPSSLRLRPRPTLLPLRLRPLLTTRRGRSQQSVRLTEQSTCTSTATAHERVQEVQPSWFAAMSTFHPVLHRQAPPPLPPHPTLPADER